MQLTANEIIEAIHGLPSSEKEKIRKALEAEKREKEERLKTQIERFKKSEKWLAENHEQYLGQWVCLEGDQLIAHGTDGMEVHRKAKEAGIESPYMVRVIEEPKAYSGAWL